MPLVMIPVVLIKSILATKVHVIVWAPGAPPRELGGAGLVAVALVDVEVGEAGVGGGGTDTLLFWAVEGAAGVVGVGVWLAVNPTRDTDHVEWLY